MALPVALFATIASFSLASVAVVASVDSQHGTTRDHSSKEAIAAADAGASVALMRLNRYANSLNGSTPCLGISGGTLAVTTAAADGWCPEIKGTVGSSSYAYRVTPKTTGTMSVVATGASTGVSRRIDVTFTAQTVASILATEGLVGRESITFSGNADIRVGVGTNGSVVSSGNATICNNIRHGVGKEWQHSGNASQCNGYSIAEGEDELPQVSTFIPPDIATSNSNYRLVTCTVTSPEPKPEGCQTDSYNGKWDSNTPFNPSTRSISLQNSVLTLSGGDYWLCSLTLSGNSHLIMAADAHVRLFFDTPEHCGTTNQISFTGNSNVEATGYKGEVGHFDMPGIYMLGSTTTRSSINLAGNNGVNEFVIYAPNTDINISGNADYKGVLAGRTINDSGNGKISQDLGFEPPQIGGATLYSRQSYIECAGGTGSRPNANC
ncbi:MAG TPA: hypothetical protein VHU14_05455 [Solirubrobacterales bacterium]|nr:hypothetical protein [Solirubrobacterales bacterium]